MPFLKGFSLGRPLLARRNSIWSNSPPKWQFWRLDSHFSHGQHVMDLGLSSWSLHRSFLNPHAGRQLTPFTFPAYARYFGVKHIEFYEGDYAPDFLSADCDDRYAERIKEQCEKEGVRVACIAAINDLLANNVDIDFQRLLKWARHCAILGCRVLRINTGRSGLSSANSSTFSQRLRMLLDHLDKNGNSDLVLAIENHPRPLCSLSDVERVLEVIDGMATPKLRACPDVGAFAPGFWKSGMELLMPRAAHVHVKPTVTDGSADAPVDLPIETYGPQLLKCFAGFPGVLSVECTEFRDLDANPYDDTKRTIAAAAKVFNITTDVMTPIGEPIPHKPQTNSDQEIIPAQPIMELFADGCEHRLESHIEIHDFASQKRVASKNVAHQRDNVPPCPSTNKFCFLVNSDVKSREKCQLFAEKKLHRIREGIQTSSEICICPMGLNVLSVPVTENNVLYGVVTASPWLEEGTEGMVFDAIIHHTQEQTRSHLEAELNSLPPFSRGSLHESQKTLMELSAQLSYLYDSERVKKFRLEKTASCILSVRKLAAQHTTPTDFVKQLSSVFNEFNLVIDSEHIELLSRIDVSSIHTRFDVVASDHDTAYSVTFTASSKPETPSQTRTAVTEELKKRQPELQFVFSTRHYGENDFIVFSFSSSVTLTDFQRSLLDQFSAEIAFSLEHLKSLEAESRARAGLEQFIDDARHSIATPVQGIADRTWQIRDLLTQQGAISRTSLKPITDDLLDYSQQTGDIIRRLSSRFASDDASHYFFVPCEVKKVVEASARKLYRAARKRSITILVRDLVVSGPMECDKKQLEIVFDNLFGNALKFASDHTTIKAKSMQSHSNECKKTWSLKASGQRYIIGNTGLGIPDEDLHRIFIRYERGKVKSVVPRDIAGTGVGLFICKQIVEAHGGKIWAECDIPISDRQKPFPHNMQNCKVRFIIDLPYKRASQ